MHHKKFTGGDYSNKFPQNANRMRTMVGSGADMSFKGGDYSNKFPQNANRMRTMVGPGADMSFVGGAYSDKFPVKGTHTNEQSGFSKANNFGHGGTLHDGNSYFSANNHDSFNPRNNHSNAAGVSRPMPTPSYRGGMISPVVGGTPNPVVSKKSRRKSEDRISVNPVGGVERQTGGDKPCSSTCKSCLDSGHLSSACNSNGKCCGAVGGARQVNKKSRRDSADRISVNPVGGVERQTAGGADCGQGCGQRGLGVVRRCQKKGCVCDDMNSSQGICVPVKSRLASNNATARKMNASGCGYNNFHHKSSFSSNISKYNTFR